MNKIDNYEQYKASTMAANWEGIFRLNGLKMDSFGTKKELKVLSAHLEENEVVLALASGVMAQTETSNLLDIGTNTWLAVATDRRLLFLDAAMMTSSVDTQSIRLDRVQAVSSSQGFMFGKITVDLGARLLEIDNCMKKHVGIFASQANKAIEAREDSQAAPQQVVVQNAPSADATPIEKLKELGALKEAGIVSEEEFAEAKAKLLAQIAA